MRCKISISLAFNLTNSTQYWYLSGACILTTSTMTEPPPPLFTCVPALLSPAPARFDKPFFQRALRTTGAGMPFKTSGPRCAKYSICVLFCKKKSSGNVTVTLNSAYKYWLICFKIICTSHTLQKRKPVKFRPCGTIIIELCLIMSIDYMQFNCKTHYEIGKLYCITMK